MIEGFDGEVFLKFVFWGLLMFFVVDMLGEFLDGVLIKGVVSGGLGVFMYFEVLDVFFSFDGVIGVFVLI